MGEEPDKTNTPLQNQALTLPMRPSRHLPRGGAGRAGGVESVAGGRHEVCWAWEEQGAPGTFWAPEKAW